MGNITDILVMHYNFLLVPLSLFSLPATYYTMKLNQKARKDNRRFSSRIKARRIKSHDHNELTDKDGISEDDYMNLGVVDKSNRSDAAQRGNVVDDVLSRGNIAVGFAAIGSKNVDESDQPFVVPDAVPVAVFSDDAINPEISSLSKYIDEQLEEALRDVARRPDPPPSDPQPVLSSRPDPLPLNTDQSSPVLPTPVLSSPIPSRPDPQSPSTASVTFTAPDDQDAQSTKETHFPVLTDGDGVSEKKRFPDPPTAAREADAPSVVLVAAVPVVFILMFIQGPKTKVSLLFYLFSIFLWVWIAFKK